MLPPVDLRPPFNVTRSSHVRLTVADLATTTGLNFGNIIYGTQPTPHRPTMVLTPSSIGKAGGTLTASDKAGACPTPVKAKSRCWWGAALTGAPNAPAGVPGFTVLMAGKPLSNTLAARRPSPWRRRRLIRASAGPGRGWR